MEDRARSIFLTASVYSKAARYINSASENDPSLLMPSQVNAALALELYFKSLYFIEQNSDFKVNGKHSHDFHALFNRLSQNIIDQLAHEFQEIIADRDMSDVDKIESACNVNVPRDLEGNLQSWSGVFTKVRYITQVVT